MITLQTIVRYNIPFLLFPVLKYRMNILTIKFLINSKCYIKPTYILFLCVVSLILCFLLVTMPHRTWLNLLAIFLFVSHVGPRFLEWFIFLHRSPELWKVTQIAVQCRIIEFSAIMTNPLILSCLNCNVL